MGHQRQGGFTLVELMIVAVIIAILTALAIPAYDAYTRKAERKEAMSALQGLAQALERYYAQNNKYDGAADGSGTPTIYPSTSPLDGTAKYNLVITNSGPSSYTLEARPIAGSGQEKDGKLMLDSTGKRAWDKDLNGSFSSSEYTWSDH